MITAAILIKRNIKLFFKDKGMRVELGYDLKRDKYISLKKFKK